MDSPITDYCRLGVVHFMLYPQCLKGDGPIVETLTTLADDPDLTAVEIGWINDAGARAEAAAALKASGKTVAFAAQPTILVGKLDLGAESADARSAATDELERVMAQAVELGAAGFAICSGPDHPAAEREAATGRTIETIVDICGRADRHGLPVVLETFDREPWAKNRLIGPNREAVALSEKIRERADNFSLLIDLSHIPLQHETPGETVPLVRDHLGHAHMGNCVMGNSGHVAYGDEHPRFGCEGGENDVPELAVYLQALVDTGYLSTGARRILSFEVKPMPGEDPAELLAHSQATLQNAWKSVK